MRASKGGSEGACEPQGERRPLVPERPQRGVGAVGERNGGAGIRQAERRRTEASGGGGSGRRRSWRRAGAEGVSE